MSELYKPWVVGEAARSSIAIVDPQGMPADPASLRIKVRSPAGTVTVIAYGTGEIVRDGAGRYHYDFVLAAPGVWITRWESDAPNAGAAEGELFVKRSRIA